MHNSEGSLVPHFPYFLIPPFWVIDSRPVLQELFTWSSSALYSCLLGMDEEQRQIKGTKGHHGNSSSCRLLLWSTFAWIPNQTLFTQRRQQGQQSWSIYSKCSCRIRLTDEWREAITKTWFKVGPCSTWISQDSLSKYHYCPSSSVAYLALVQYTALAVITCNCWAAVDDGCTMRSKVQIDLLLSGLSFRSARVIIIKSTWKSCKTLFPPPPPPPLITAQLQLMDKQWGWLNQEQMFASHYENCVGLLSFITAHALFNIGMIQYSKRHGIGRILWPWRHCA